MRACPVCGASNGPTDDFCGNCGTYLGWSEDPAPSGTSPEPAPSTPAEPPPPSTPAEPSSAVPAEPSSRTPARPVAPGTPPAPSAARASGPTASEPPAAGAPPAVPPAAPPDAARPAAAPAAPPARTGDPAATAGASTAPAPIQPVRPAKAVAPRPVVRPVEAPDEVVGAPCPSCGTPNPPGRRFCRRCATPLNPAAEPEALPWWRTVWPFRRRVRASSGRGVRLLVILAVVVALCAGAVLLLPAGRALFEDTRDKLGTAEPITPVGIEASAASPRHPAKNTTDGVSNSYWGAPAEGASVTYTFRRPFRLVDVIITNGPSNNPEVYSSEARALRIDLEVTTQDGERQDKELDLSDKPGPQTIHIAISDVKTVRLVLREPVDLTSGRQLALAEVEFFQRG
ncbi:Double zinc ribbon [Streptomyces sp. LamerLS-316]|nr:zinc-ribbon domain-containing protein [Streptomyces sp. SID4921]MYQ42398.1 zinc ribbon domain-containing protein [Streptomyces sp. SID4921]SCK53463.1 Double zinc ribbon [Streptomyces sp. LamerLS-316]